MMQEILSWFGLTPQTLFASIVGAITGVNFLPAQLSWRERFLAMLGGFGCAIYLPPLLLVTILQLESPDIEMVSAAAFISGVVGLHIVGGLVTLARAFRADPMGVLQRWRK